MAHLLKKKIADKDMPTEFSTHTIKAINRIEEHPNVIGIMYFRSGSLELTTMPESMSYSLTSKLPHISSDFRRAVNEIDILDELLAFRIETNSMEIIVTGNKEFSACVVLQITRNKKRKNQTESEPVLTNINLMNATNYGIAMRYLGAMSQASIKDLDPFDEVLILRIHTKKIEIMLAPHPEFNIIVMQNSRVKIKQKKNE